MPVKPKRWIGAAVVASALGATFAPRLALADDKATCVAAYEKTQTLRKQNKLIESREQALICARDKCPKLVKADCAKWIEEVTGSQPTLVFTAHDARGHDRADVKVILDGAPLTEQLGQEVTVDPGPHTIRFEAPNSLPAEQSVVVRAGEKARPVTVTFSDPAPATEAPRPNPGKESSDRRPIPLLVPVLGVAGLAAAGVGAFLVVDSSSRLDDLRGKCAPHCEQSDVDTLNLRYRIAAASIGVGAIAVGVAVWLFVTRPRAASSTVGLSPSGVALRF
jgi:hypothetical protein